MQNSLPPNQLEKRKGADLGKPQERSSRRVVHVLSHARVLRRSTKSSVAFRVTGVPQAAAHDVRRRSSNEAGELMGHDFAPRTKVDTLLHTKTQ